MKRKYYAAIMFLTISGVTVPMTGSCLQVMAQQQRESRGKRLILQCWQGVWTSG